jgi:hypothetical protein
LGTVPIVEVPEDGELLDAGSPFLVEVGVGFIWYFMDAKFFVALGDGFEAAFGVEIVESTIEFMS